MFDLDLGGDIARLTLRRPEARNAIPLTGWDELAASIGQVAASPARLLIVEGEGGAFCAGADLDDFGKLREDEAERSRFRLAMRGALDGLAGLPIPAIALIEGACYGAGVALALACDVRLAGSGARFAVTPAKMGISFPQEDVHRLVGQIGRGAASRLLFTGEAIEVGEAMRIRLVDGLADEGEALVAAILAADAVSVASLKRAISLAAADIRSDPEQDRLFEALFRSDALGRRLAERSKR